MKISNDRYYKRPMQSHQMNYADIAKKQKQIEDNMKYQKQVNRCKSVLKEPPE